MCYGREMEDSGGGEIYLQTIKKVSGAGLGSRSPIGFGLLQGEWTHGPDLALLISGMRNNSKENLSFQDDFDYFVVKNKHRSVIVRFVTKVPYLKNTNKHRNHSMTLFPPRSLSRGDKQNFS
ncbi:hypothetical protein TNCV_712371 [Trichonephila clavipes]|nr:hypothetical protein TNCV_712371 [Trichonephila clavipes]